MWRAIAGMAAALAVGALIVSAEFSATLVHRTSHLNHRIATLNRSVHQLKRRLTFEEKKKLSAEQTAKADEILKRVLAAHDVQTIKLTKPHDRHLRPVAPQADGVVAAAMLATSASADAAVLQVGGLPALQEHRSYAIWWVSRRGHRTFAGEFEVDRDGKATVPLATAPRSLAGVEVTSEPDSERILEEPSGAIALRGAASRATGTR